MDGSAVFHLPNPIKTLASQYVGLTDVWTIISRDCVKQSLFLRECYIENHIVCHLLSMEIISDLRVIISPCVYKTGYGNRHW